MVTCRKVRVVGPDDVEAVLDFLARHAASTMFLRGNLLRAGAVDRGARLEGTYAAAFEGGTVTAVAAHYWNDNLILEAPDHLDEVVAVATAASGRPVRGILGRSSQVRAAREALGMTDLETTLESSEGLFFLRLATLRVPGLLTDGSALCRVPRERELPLLVAWRAAYRVEALGATDADAVHAQAKDEIHAIHEDGLHWVLEVGGELVAYSAFNATVPDCVQIGGVWTPPALRGRGYGRSVVAGTLLLAHKGGVSTSVLFTENPAAERAYRSLGFERTGDYAIVFFAEPA